MLELLFNVLLQLAILTGSASGEEAKGKSKAQAAKATTQSTAPSTPGTKIGSGGWDDKD